MELDSNTDHAVTFYAKHYAHAKPLFLRPGTRVVLGEQNHRLCRFCGQGEPGTSFRHKAHAIPELLGNKSIFTNFECDNCNGIH